MTARTALIWIAISVAIGSVLLAVAVSRLITAHHQAVDAQQRVQQVRHDAERVLALRDAAETVATGEQPSQDVYQRVNQMLNETGLRHVRVQSVTPAGDKALDTREAYREQTVRVVLAPITVNELGSLLNRWQQTQTLWHITTIELAVVQGRGAQAGTYTATLSASAVYVPVSGTAAMQRSP